MEIDWIDWTALALSSTGAALIGLMGLGMIAHGEPHFFNFVRILSQKSGLEIIEPSIYILFGLSGLYQAYFADKLQRND